MTPDEETMVCGRDKDHEMAEMEETHEERN
jgi:hypothetical protein